MRRSSRRLAAFLLLLPVVLVAVAYLYMLGMRHLEGHERAFLDSLAWASETMTTTGYGSDSSWDHPVMIIFVVAVQLMGVGAAVMVFPVFVIPWLEERFEARLPTVVPDLTDTVLIYRYNPAVATLVAALEREKVAVLILEEDEAVARRLLERAHRTVYADLERDDPELPNLASARAVVAAGDDHNNAVITLTARQQGFEGPVVALVENPSRRSAMVAAGATAAFTPLHVLAAAVAAKASARINPRVSGVQSLGAELEIAEVRIDAASELAGTTLADARVRSRTGSTVIGRWIDGVLGPEPGPNEVLSVGSILVAAGSGENLARLNELATPVAREGAFFVLGFDQVGRKVAEFLADAGEEVVVIAEGEVGTRHTAVAGDPMDPEVLSKAGITAGQAAILALGSDAATLFCAAIVRDLAPEVGIVAAVERVENVGRIRRAGADFALSLGQVAGQLLAFQVLGEESVQLEPQIRVVKSDAGPLVGKTLGESRIRQRTGCSVVAVERRNHVVVDLTESYVFSFGDRVYVSGTPDTIRRYFDVFPEARA
jgi:Trk K+ transport system NAD-binding subunit